MLKTACFHCPKGYLILKEGENMARAYIDLNNISEELNKRIEEIEEHLDKVRRLADDLKLDLIYDVKVNVEQGKE